MSGFNLAELLPFYMDETDEHIALLNDSLLRLEADPSDAPALQETFRIFHSIKGASVVMGFQSVNRLTHHLETLFDELRAGKRILDRPALNLTFRCLDELRDYHKDLRSRGESSVDLTNLVQEVVSYLEATAPGAHPALVAASQSPASAQAAEPPPLETGVPTRIVVVFESNLPLVDMKARLVLNRLAAQARILRSQPTVEELDQIESLERLSIDVVTECDASTLVQLADVEGAKRVYLESPESARVEPLATVPIATPEPAHSLPTPVLTGATATRPSTPPSEVAEPVPPRAEPGSTKARMVETIRVDSDRLDHLMNLAGELVLTKARFSAIARGLDDLFKGTHAHALKLDTRERLDVVSRSLETLTTSGAAASGGSIDRIASHIRRLRDQFQAIENELERIGEAREQLKSLSDTVHSLGRVSDSLQKGVLDTRMVPIGPLFERFRRVIRDLSVSSGKEVALRIAGEKTELDKRMIDELSDPLIHMVRNGVDHGLERPEDRVAAGKPRTGTISLSASHRGNSVVITASDDGRGIDIERVRKKIVANGLITAEDAAALSDRELTAFIWHPGLSTAETITDVSGRGVGMDIVKNRIESLNGAVDVRSVLGQGTTFTIRLPLTLAIMSCLLVRIHDEVYAIPLDHLDEIVEIRPGQLFKVQGRPALELRKKIIALVTLDDVFIWGGGAHPRVRDRANRANGEAQAAGGNGNRIVVIVQNGETTIGLLVDDLIGMQEVVLKSIERNFRAIPGLSGASILGDGRVSLILDLDAVIERAARRPLAANLNSTQLAASDV